MTALLEMGLALVIALFIGLGAYFSGDEGVLFALVAIGGIATCLVISAIIVRIIMAVFDLLFYPRREGNHRG